MKLVDKIKDYFNVAKYKRQRNTFENKYNSRNEDYIKILEDYHDLSIKYTEQQSQIKEQKKEIKILTEQANMNLNNLKKKRG